eukprot:gene28119-31233_t
MVTGIRSFDVMVELGTEDTEDWCEICGCIITSRPLPDYNSGADAGGGGGVEEYGSSITTFQAATFPNLPPIALMQIGSSAQWDVFMELDGLYEIEVRLGDTILTHAVLVNTTRPRVEGSLDFWKGVLYRWNAKTVPKEGEEVPEVEKEVKPMPLLRLTLRFTDTIESFKCRNVKVLDLTSFAKRTYSLLLEGVPGTMASCLLHKLSYMNTLGVFGGNDLLVNIFVPEVVEEAPLPAIPKRRATDLVGDVVSISLLTVYSSALATAVTGTALVPLFVLHSGMMYSFQHVQLLAMTAQMAIPKLSEESLLNFQDGVLGDDDGFEDDDDDDDGSDDTPVPLSPPLSPEARRALFSTQRGLSTEKPVGLPSPRSPQASLNAEPPVGILLPPPRTPPPMFTESHQPGGFSQVNQNKLRQLVGEGNVFSRAKEDMEGGPFQRRRLNSESLMVINMTFLLGLLMLIITFYACKDLSSRHQLGVPALAVLLALPLPFTALLWWLTLGVCIHGLEDSTASVNRKTLEPWGLATPDGSDKVSGGWKENSTYGSERLSKQEEHILEDTWRERLPSRFETQIQDFARDGQIVRHDDPEEVTLSPLPPTPKENETEGLVFPNQPARESLLQHAPRASGAAGSSQVFGSAGAIGDSAASAAGSGEHIGIAGGGGSDGGRTAAGTAGSRGSKDSVDSGGAASDAGSTSGGISSAFRVMRDASIFEGDSYRIQSGIPEEIRGLKPTQTARPGSAKRALNRMPGSRALMHSSSSLARGMNKPHNMRSINLSPDNPLARMYSSSSHERGMIKSQTMTSLNRSPKNRLAHTSDSNRSLTNFPRKPTSLGASSYTSSTSVGGSSGCSGDGGSEVPIYPDPGPDSTSNRSVSASSQPGLGLKSTGSVRVTNIKRGTVSKRAAGPNGEATEVREWNFGPGLTGDQAEDAAPPELPPMPRRMSGWATRASNITTRASKKKGSEAKYRVQDTQNGQEGGPPKVGVPWRGVNPLRSHISKIISRHTKLKRMHDPKDGQEGGPPQKKVPKGGNPFRTRVSQFMSRKSQFKKRSSKAGAPSFPPATSTTIPTLEPSFPLAASSSSRRSSRFRVASTSSFRQSPSFPIVATSLNLLGRPGASQVVEKVPARASTVTLDVDPGLDAGATPPSGQDRTGKVQWELVTPPTAMRNKFLFVFEDVAEILMLLYLCVAQPYFKWYLQMMETALHTSMLALYGTALVLSATGGHDASMTWTVVVFFLITCFLVLICELLLAWGPGLALQVELVQHVSALDQESVGRRRRSRRRATHPEPKLSEASETNALEFYDPCTDALDLDDPHRPHSRWG